MRRERSAPCEIGCVREETVEVEAHAGRDEEDGDEHAVAHRLELPSELRMGHRLVAVDELDDCSGEESPEDRFEAEPVGKDGKEREQEERCADANWSPGLKRTIAPPPPAASAVTDADRPIPRPRPTTDHGVFIQQTVHSQPRRDRRPSSGGLKRVGRLADSYGLDGVATVLGRNRGDGNKGVG
jgi:hypothetical protein